MAQSGFTPIQVYRSTTPGAVPLAGNLAPGELALNLADEKLFFENAAGTVVSIDRANGTVTSVAASGGTTGLSFTGSPITTTGTLTLTGTLAVANGGTGTTTSTGFGSVVLSTGATMNGATLLSATATGLSIATGSAFTPPLRFTGDTDTGMFSPGANSIGFGGGGVEYMRFDSAGNALLGTTTNAGITAIGGAAVGQAIQSPYPVLALIDSGDPTNKILWLANDGGPGSLTTKGAFSLRLGTNNTTRVTITSSGSVGIGTVSPSTMLHVAGALTLDTALSVANGGTGATTASAARTGLGATTVGANVFTLTNPSAVAFLRFNADNTVSALNAADFRTAIGAGTGSGTVTSVAASGGTTGLSFTGSPITAAGTLTLSGTLAIANGGTGATTAATARTALGSTTLGDNLFIITNPSAVTFPRFNADNTVSALNAADFRTAIGAGSGSGSVTSVGGTGTVNGITLTGTVTSSGSLTLGGTLSNVSLTSQVTGTLPVANGGTGATDAGTARSNLSAAASGAVGSSGLTMNTARMLGRATASSGAIEEITIGTGLSLSAGTLTATASGGTVTSVAASGGTTGLSFTGSPITSSGTLTLTGTLAVANGGTGGTSQSTARAGLGSTTVGDNLFTLTNPSAIRFLRVNADNTVSALDAPNFRSAIGAGTGSGTVTSVSADGGTTGMSFTGGPVTGSGTLSLAGTLAVTNGGTGATTASAARSGLGATVLGANFFTLTNPSSVTFVRINADNTISTLDAATFRTAIGAGTSSTTGTVTSVAGTGTVNGLSLSGTVTGSGNLTLGGTLSGVSLTTQVSGTLPVGNGGTGITTTPSNGQIPIGNGTNYTAATLTAGNNTAITNASGSVTVGAGALTTAGTTNGALVAADAFKQVKATGGVTMPANVFSADQYVYIRNTTAGNITVTQGGSLTLRFVALTGNRTLAQYGFMTVLYISATEAWVVGGVGVT